MIKKILLIMIAVFVAFLVYINFKENKKNKFTIALLQTASHPALNKAKEACINYLNSIYNFDIDIIYQNGEGASDNLQVFAKQLLCNDACQLYIGIGSPAVQALAKLEKNKPILFAAVTDPKILGIDNQSNVCGITDQVDYINLIEILIKLFKDKKIGIIYTIGDLSSEFTLNQLENSKLIFDSKIIRYGFGNESELMAITEKACQEVDVILIPTDNAVASAINLIIAVSKKYNTHLFMTDALLFELGGKYGLGVDYEAQGKELGKIVEAILDKKNNPGQIGIIQPISSGLLVR
jgi:putative ABC transport system substrate-binding protein